jgi:hypothetical protein
MPCSAEEWLDTRSRGRCKNVENAGTGKKHLRGSNSSVEKKKCGDGDVMAPGERESDLNYSLVVSSLLDRAGAVPVLIPRGE